MSGKLHVTERNMASYDPIPRTSKYSKVCSTTSCLQLKTYHYKVMVNVREKVQQFNYYFIFHVNESFPIDYIDHRYNFVTK